MNNNKINLLPAHERNSFLGLMVTPCATAAVQRATQLRSAIAFYILTLRNANASGTLQAMPTLHYVSSQCLCVSASMSPSHVKVILILAARYGRLPSPKVRSLSQAM